MPYSPPDVAKSVRLKDDTLMQRVSAHDMHAYLSTLRQLRVNSDQTTSGGLVIASAGSRSCAWSQDDFFEFTERPLQLERPLDQAQAQEVERDRSQGMGMGR